MRRMTTWQISAFAIAIAFGLPSVSGTAYAKGGIEKPERPEKHKPEKPEHPEKNKPEKPHRK